MSPGGPIVHTAELVAALEGGAIAGAGLDLVGDTPDLLEKLINMENVLVTPHIAAPLIMADSQTDENPIAPPRTLAELKAETQARADRQAFPLGGKRPEDVREALSRINTLEPDDWAAAFSILGQRYYEKARAEEPSDPRAACLDFHQAWQYYWFARWPVCNSDGKRAAFASPCHGSSIAWE